jgi:hypothetical protein
MLISNSFILRRFNGSFFSDILQYNITSDMIKKVSSLSSSSSNGLAVKGKDNKYIYYFGGSNTRTEIHRFDAVTKATVKLTTVLPSEAYRAAGVSTIHSVFIFNGYKNNILRFNLDSDTVKIVEDLSFGNDTVLSTLCVTDSTSNRVWIFPGSKLKLSSRRMIFNTIPERKRSFFTREASNSVHWPIRIHHRGNREVCRIGWK